MIADESGNKIHILIVENNIVLRKGLSQLLNFEEDIDVCGVSSTVDGALELLSFSTPDIVILDIALDGKSGMDLLKEVTMSYPAIPVIVLSMHEESFFIDRCLKIGARGYILKQDAPESIVDAIHTVLSGKSYISKSIGYIPSTNGIFRS